MHKAQKNKPQALMCPPVISSGLPRGGGHVPSHSSLSRIEVGCMGVRVQEHCSAFGMYIAVCCSVSYRTSRTVPAEVRKSFQNDVPRSLTPRASGGEGGGAGAPAAAAARFRRGE